ncbi:diaminopimelate decarboxylase [Paenibacillus sp. 481]|uniref:diaminopimelate decarboxylase n=1 Tax=Paenibacillus sp. 481 TaxID=2835869 RepID=UPI001E3FAFC9|nr:diaminopimelate decarboxylase [Paenibacillus sp. 481]UHA71975.1 diaminopimelate decarboxylase [Paenibacillus sp. 481]
MNARGLRDDQPIFCLGCKRLFIAEDTILQFRTGFIQGHTPVGCCHGCVSEHKSLNALWISLTTEQPYDCVMHG